MEIINNGSDNLAFGVGMGCHCACSQEVCQTVCIIINKNCDCSS